jgi:hypothetical protein
MGTLPFPRGALQALVMYALSIIWVRDDNYTRCEKLVLVRYLRNLLHFSLGGRGFSPGVKSVE